MISKIIQRLSIATPACTGRTISGATVARHFSGPGTWGSRGDTAGGHEKHGDLVVDAVNGNSLW